MGLRCLNKWGIGKRQRMDVRLRYLQPLARHHRNRFNRWSIFSAIPILLV